MTSDGVFNYTYDTEGNRLTRTRISGAAADDYRTEYVWDHRNRLTGVVLKNNSLVKKRELFYEYDHLNRLVRRRLDNTGGGDIIEQFRALGYDVTEYSRNKIFGRKGTGEIDLLLEDGDIVILIEVKTTLKIDDVKDHMERLEKYRRHIDEKNNNIDRRKFIGAVAAASVADHVVKFAQRNGLYVIVQSGRTAEILTQPEGFVAKRW